MNNLPIACTLTPADLRARRDQLLYGLLARALERVERPDGVAWRFEARSDVLQAIAAVIDAERQCCAFLRFELTVEPGNGPVWLGVTGPPGTSDFLRGLGVSEGSDPISPLSRSSNIAGTGGSRAPETGSDPKSGV